MSEIIVSYSPTENFEESQVLKISRRHERYVYLSGTNLLNKFYSRTDLDYPGTYIAISRQTEDEPLTVYVGEGNRVFLELCRKKWDEQRVWDGVFVITSPRFTKKFIKYLEHILHRYVKDRVRVICQNKKVPSRPNISEEQEMMIRDIIPVIGYLCSVFDVNIFRSDYSQGYSIFYCDGKLYVNDYKETDCLIRKEHPLYGKRCLVYEDSVLHKDKINKFNSTVHFQTKEMLKQQNIIRYDEITKVYITTRDFILDNEVVTASIINHQKMGRPGDFIKEDNINNYF